MSDEARKMTAEELDALTGDELPERAVMSLINGSKLIVPIGQPVHIVSPDPIVKPTPIVEGQS
ncbi:MAG TPA: hypothetical protein VHT30_02675 [Acidimicrobiales bacterium]|jgi:hypothetical protein|nr:hypothetical protein [Acidimicrobiales bacterium]